MKIVVIGGSGLIGTKLSAILKQKGHDVIAASGVDWSTGPAVAPGVPVSVAPVSSVVPDDIVSDGVVALEVEAPAEVGVAAGSTDFEQAASETDASKGAASNGIRISRAPWTS